MLTKINYQLRRGIVDSEGRISTGERIKKSVFQILGWKPGTILERELIVDFALNEISITLKPKEDS